MSGSQNYWSNTHAKAANGKGCLNTTRFMTISTQTGLLYCCVALLLLQKNALLYVSTEYISRNFFIILKSEILSQAHPTYILIAFFKPEFGLRFSFYSITKGQNCILWVCHQGSLYCASYDEYHAADDNEIRTQTSYILCVIQYLRQKIINVRKQG